MGQLSTAALVHLTQDVLDAPLEPGGDGAAQHTLGHCLDFGHRVLYWEGPGAAMGGRRRKDQPRSWRGARQGENSVQEPVPREQDEGACLPPVLSMGCDLQRHCSDFTKGSAGSRLGKLSLRQPHWPPFPTAFYRDPGMGRCRPMKPSPMCSKAAGPRARPYWGLCWTSSAVLGAKGPAGWASSSGGQGALPPPRPYLSWVHPSPGVLCMDV